MADINDMNNNNFDTVSGVDTIPKKKKGAKAAAFGIGAAAVIAGGGIAAYNLSGYVKNQVKLRILSPEKYYAWVTEENARTFAESAAESYSRNADRIKAGQSETVNIRYEVSDAAKDMLLSDYLGADSSDSNNALINIIKNIKNIELGVSSDMKNGVVSGNIYANLNSERLVTLDVAMDDSSTDYFFRVPELNEQWIIMNLGEVMDSIYADEESEKIMNAYREAMKDPSSFMTAEELQDLIERYSGIWGNIAQDAETEKNVSVDICDIAAEYTAVSFELNGEQTREIVNRFAEEARNDAVLRRIAIEKLGVVTEEEYNSSIDELVSEADSGEYAGNSVGFTTYIDPKGVIRGFRASDGNDVLSYVLGMDGDQIRAESYVTQNNQDEARFELYAQDNDGKYTGNLNVYSEGETVSVDFADFEVVDKDMGYVSGSVSITAPDDSALSFELSSDGTSQELSSGIDIEGVDYGKIIVSFSGAESANPSVPDKASAYLIDENTQDFMSEYVNQQQLTDFLNGLLTKVGFNDEYSKSISELASSYVYGGGISSYDDDDDDFDDFDFDDYDDDDDDDDPYVSDLVEAESGQAYLAVADGSFEAIYVGTADGGSLAYGAEVADITGDGTYTVSVTADTDGYRNYSDSNPDGLYLLAVEIDGIENAENADITIKSIRFDGKEYNFDGDAYIESDGDNIGAVIYAEGSDLTSFDASDIGEWTTAEVTFEITGLE